MTPLHNLEVSNSNFCIDGKWLVAGWCHHSTKSYATKPTITITATKILAVTQAA